MNACEIGTVRCRCVIWSLPFLAVLYSAFAAFGQSPEVNQSQRSVSRQESADAQSTVAESGPQTTWDTRFVVQADYFELTPHEYGPSGYVRRPYDSGPELPVVVPVRSPSRASSSTVGLAGGTRKTLLKWGGRVHLDMPIDLDPIGNPAEFVTSTIPVPQQRGGNTNFSARASRLQLKSQTDTSAGAVTAFAEWDFFDGSNQAASGSYRPRLRFFYFDVGHFRVGQDASVFMDYSAYPNVIDNEGPASMILIRQPLIRMTMPLGDRWNVAIAGEQPYTDLTIPVDASGDPVGGRLQEIPDFTAHLRYDSEHGHAQTSGVVRRLTFETPSEDQHNATGYGINLTGDLHVWSLLGGGSPLPARCPSPLEKCRITCQYAAGFGIARYLQDTNGLGLDAALDTAGELDALFARGWYVGYEQWWTDRLSSIFLVGENANSGTDALAGDTYAGATYVATNLIWNYSADGWVGFEYLWGQRQNLNGDRADANRLQLGIRHTF